MVVNFISWWAGLALLGLAFLPLVERIFPVSFPDRGRAFAKPLALVGFTYLSWLLTSAGIPHGASLGVSGALLAGAAGWAWQNRLAGESDPSRADAPDGGAPTPSGLRRWLRAEAVFAVTLLLFAFLRALQPAIFGAEKYMDFAFFNTLLRAQHFPPQDPWMGGVAINYYYFGYLMFADLARFTHVPPEVAYNLSLATVGAMAAGAAACLGRFLSGSAWGGALAVAATVLIGNLDGARQLLLERRTLSFFDYWRSTRIVPHTINEFPFFSLLHGDLHPHVTALVIDVSLIGVALAMSQAFADRRQSGLRPFLPGLVALGILLGALALTNPWDVPVYFALLGVLAAHRLWDERRPLATALSIGALLLSAAFAMVVLSLPFSLHFRAQFHGIGLVRERTALVPFLTVFAFLLFVPAWRLVEEMLAELREDPPARDLVLACVAFTAVALYLATRSPVLILASAVTLGSLLVLFGPDRGQRGTLAVALLAVAALAIDVGEVVYLRDPYGSELHRMNTIFKLYFQAWLLLALALPGLTRDLLARLGYAGRALVVVCLLLGLAASLCYPAAAIYTRWPPSDRGAPFLDGLAYLRRDHPSDAAAIRWLGREASGLPVVLEATGDPYSYFARVSANTGLPTVLGWGNHERVWRGLDARISERARDVGQLYAETDLDQVRALLLRYRVRWVFIGDLEREHYPSAGLDKFASHPELFEAAYRSGSTEVFRVRDTTVKD
jgi:YYY domain-containing protein